MRLFPFPALTLIIICVILIIRIVIKMKKKGKLQKSIFEIIADPYGGESAECFDHIFTEWQNNADNTIKIGGITYYKALQIIRTAMHRKEELIMGLSNEMSLKIGDTIIDELGNKYLVNGFGMFRFKTNIPDWYSKISFVFVSGNHKNVGEYFAKM